MNVIINGVNVHPGSHVLLTAPEGWELEEIQDLKYGLESRLPGVNFTFIDGVKIIGVYDEEPKVLELEN